MILGSRAKKKSVQQSTAQRLGTARHGKARHGFVKRINFVCSSSSVWKCLSLLLPLCFRPPWNLLTRLCASSSNRHRRQLVIVLLIDHLLLFPPPPPPSTLTRRHKNNTSSWPTTTTPTTAHTVSQLVSYLRKEECRECVARLQLKVKKETA